MIDENNEDDKFKKKINMKFEELELESLDLPDVKVKVLKDNWYYIIKIACKLNFNFYKLTIR